MIHLNKQSSKDQWRDWAKAERDEHIDALVSTSVIEKIAQWGAFENAKHVLSYMAFGSEINLAALDFSTKHGYVTRTWMKPVHLTVHEQACELERHRYGYLQPVKDAPVINPNILDIVLVPGLAFDKSGNRLGYGMGFYDRLLSQLRPNCLRVAITCDALFVDELPTEEHDVAMTHVVTESGITTIAI